MMKMIMNCSPNILLYIRSISGTKLSLDDCKLHWNTAVSHVSLVFFTLERYEQIQIDFFKMNMWEDFAQLLVNQKHTHGNINIIAYMNTNIYAPNVKVLIECAKNFWLILNCSVESLYDKYIKCSYVNMCINIMCS